MIKEGQKAPAFSLLDDSGEKLSLGDFKGKKIVLYFYPKDMTPGCTLQACDFQAATAKFKKQKTQVLGISKDPVEKHQTFKKKYSLDFPLLADIDGKACEAYGVWKEKSLYGRKFMGIERTTFIIDSKGKIAKIFPKVKVKGHSEAVLAALAEID